MEQSEQPQRPSMKKTGTIILEQNNENSNNNNQKIKKQKSAILTRYPSHLLKFGRKAVFEDGNGVNDWLHKFLPYEILLFIFTMIPRSDFVNVSRVCKHFRAVTQDPMFGWITILKLSFRAYGVKLDGVDLASIELRFDEKVWRGGWNLSLPSGQVLTHLDHHIESGLKSWRARYNREQAEHEYRNEITKEALAGCKTHPSLLRYFVTVHQTQKWVFYVNFQAHIHTLELLARKAEPIPMQSHIIECVRTEAKQIADARLPQYIGNKEAKVPFKSNIAPKQPPGLSEGINLYKYQLDAVRWMTSVESDIAAIPWRAAKTELLFDLKNEAAVPASKIPENITKIYFKGGVLADEMGLGKTMEILGLILSNPQTMEEEADANTLNTASVETEETEDESEDAMAKLRFQSKATMIVCPNHLVHQWNEEFTKFAQNELKILQITTVPQLKAFSYDDIAQADMVIVALQLFKYAGYQNIGKVGKRATNVKTKTNYKGRGARVATSLKRLRNRLAKGQSADEPPLLEHFHWHRLVIDEAHEVFADKDFRNIFSPFRGKYCWYVSGTPIPNETVLAGVLEFLKFPSDDSAQCSQHIFADMFWNNLYWRNTKESVKDEYAVPDVVEDLVLLEFSEVEKVLYKEFDAENKKKLCSKMHHVGSCKTLSDIKDYKIEEKKRLIKLHRTTIFALNQELVTKTEKTKKVKADLDTHEAHKPILYDSQYYNTLYKLRTKHRNLLVRCQNIPNETKLQEAGLAHEQELLALYEAVVRAEHELQLTGQKTYREKLAETNKFSRALSTAISKPSSKGKNANNNNNDDDMDTEPLPTDSEIAAMKAMEIKEFILKHNLTPKTKKVSESTKQEAPLKKQKTEALAPSAPAEPTDARVESAKELLEIVERLGTKMGNLIYYLKKLWNTTPSSRVIIFSQFDSVLAQVDELLSQNGIKTVSIKGTATQKSEALNSFKDTDSEVKVILLSLAKAASGSNLIQASHVVLIDPISGTKEEVQAVESQAIGRAYRQGQSQHVTVVRLLIKGTEEHEMYTKILTDSHAKDAPISTMNRTGSSLLFRSSSVSSVLANVAAPSASDVVKLVEQVEPHVEPEDSMLNTEDKIIENPPEADMQMENAINQQ